MGRRNSSRILEIRDLGVTFFPDVKPIHVIYQIAFDVIRGSTLGIVGESGSGKSLLCKSLLQLHPVNSMVQGVVTFYPRKREKVDLLSLSSRNLKSIRGKMVGFLFQEPTTSLNPVVKCGKQLSDAFNNSIKINKATGKDKVVSLLGLVGLTDPEKVANSFPHELSGGMIQRVALAAALAGDPELLIADEPTTALDASGQRKILERLSDLKKELGLTLILVSHDLTIISAWADNLLVMYHGRIVEYGDTKTMISSPSHPYTQALLDTERSFQRNGLPNAIPGEIPSIVEPPTGCRFHPRCRYVKNRCSVEEPGPGTASHGGEMLCFYPLR